MGEVFNVERCRVCGDIWNVLRPDGGFICPKCLAEAAEEQAAAEHWADERDTLDGGGW